MGLFENETDPKIWMNSEIEWKKNPDEMNISAIHSFYRKLSDRN